MGQLLCRSNHGAFMKTRTLSVALALLFAISAASGAAPAACCSPAEADRTLTAVDCCSTMVECPLVMKASAPAVFQGEGQGLPAAALAAAPGSPAIAAIAFPSFDFAPLEPAFAGPRLYRLHSRLRI